MTKQFKNAHVLINKVLKYRYFTNPNPPIPVLYSKGSTPLVLVLGDNAGGKSFVRKVMQLVCDEAKIECMAISMNGRQSIGMAPWLTFVYGDEGQLSTGYNSVGTVLTGIKTCQEREHSHVILWDEPDLGLSESWAAGVGVRIRQFVESISQHTIAAVVSTHSKALVKELLSCNPHFLHVGQDPVEAPKTVQEWLDRPCVPQDPEELQKRCKARFKAIQAKINEGRKK